MTLSITIAREIKPDEIASLIFGTGALSWGSWWVSATWIRPDADAPDARRVIRRPLDDDVDLKEFDVIEFVVDDPNEGEGSGKTVSRLVTLEQMAAAASRVIANDGVHVDDESTRDMAREDLGYADAIAADAVMQMAVFDEVIFG
jgi:hypothetical protein